MQIGGTKIDVQKLCLCGRSFLIQNNCVTRVYSRKGNGIKIVTKNSKSIHLNDRN